LSSLLKPKQSISGDYLKTINSNIKILASSLNSDWVTASISQILDEPCLLCNQFGKILDEYLPSHQTLDKEKEISLENLAKSSTPEHFKQNEQSSSTTFTKSLHMTLKKHEFELLQ